MVWSKARPVTTDDAPFHAHIYFTPRLRGAAVALREKLAGNPAILFAGALSDGPVGPHPIAQFEVHFPASAVGAVTAAIEASELSALLHPLTDDDLADHTTLARWIGEPLELDLSVLDPPGQNKGVARFGVADF